MAYVDEVLADNPTGYWRLNETAGGIMTDEMAVNSGAYDGLTLLGQPAPYHIDGFSARRNGGVLGTVPHNPNMNSPTACTFECWAAVHDLSQVGASIPIMSRSSYTSGGLQQMAITVYPSGGWGAFGDIGGADTNADAGAAALAVAGEWVHLVATIDTTLGGNQLVLYVNGQPVTSATQAGALSEPVTDLTLGGAHGFGTPVHCSLTDVAIYAGQALTADRVLAHYNAGIIDTSGQITGHVTLDGTPGVATIRAYRHDTGVLLKEVQSAPGDGSYTVAGLEPAVPVDILVFAGAGVFPQVFTAVSPVVP